MCTRANYRWRGAGSEPATNHQVVPWELSTHHLSTHLAYDKAPPRRAGNKTRATRYIQKTNIEIQDDLTTTVLLSIPKTQNKQTDKTSSLTNTH